MNEGIHLDLDTWIVPGQIRKANLCQYNNILTDMLTLTPALPLSMTAGLSTPSVLHLEMTVWGMKAGMKVRCLQT